MKQIIIFFLIYFNAIICFCQGELTLQMLKNCNQSSYTNPAFHTKHRISIGIPVLSSIYFGYGNSGFSFLDALDTQKGKKTINLNKLVDATQYSNLLYEGINLEVFHLKVKWRNAFVGFYISSKQYLYFSYPKDFLYLTTGNNVNTDYSGRRMDLSTLQLSFMHYNEYAFDYSRLTKWHNHTFTYGIRLKLLQGLSNIDFSPINLQMNSGDFDQQLKINQDLYIRSSGLYSFDKDSFKLYNFNSNYFSKFNNPGFAFDFGLVYPYKKFNFSLSVLNLGFIYWTNQISRIHVPAQTIVKGVDVIGLLNDNFQVSSLSGAIANQYKPKSEPENGYLTWLTPQVYLTADYRIRKNIFAYSSIFVESFRTVRTGLLIGTKIDLKRYLTVTPNISYRYRQFNFGFGFIVKPGPIQWYFASDNLFTTYYVDSTSDILIPLPWESKVFNVRTGINFVIGTLRDNQKLIQSE